MSMQPRTQSMRFQINFEEFVEYEYITKSISLSIVEYHFQSLNNNEDYYECNIVGNSNNNDESLEGLNETNGMQASE